MFFWLRIKVMTGTQSLICTDGWCSQRWANMFDVFPPFRQVDIRP